MYADRINLSDVRNIASEMQCRYVVLSASVEALARESRFTRSLSIRTYVVSDRIFSGFPELSPD